MKLRPRTRTEDCQCIRIWRIFYLSTRPRLLRSRELRLVVPEPIRDRTSSVAVDDSTRSLASRRTPCRTWSNRLAQLPAFVFDVAPFAASGLEGSARAPAAFGHSHDDEYLHAGGAWCDAGGQQQGRRNDSTNKESGMRKRGGKRAAIGVPKDAKSFRFRPTASS